MKYGIILTATLLMTGCNSVWKAPPTKDLTAVTPSNYQAKNTNYINEVIRPSMKDPYSMQIVSHSKPKKITCRNPRSHQRSIVWASIAHINSKNSFGAYTGAKPYLVYYNNGRASDIAFGALLDWDHPLCNL